MLVFYLSSINALGATVTTRHFSPYGVAVEQAQRAATGHHAFSTQEVTAHANGAETCTKRKAIAPPRHRGGRHA